MRSIVFCSLLALPLAAGAVPPDEDPTPQPEAGGDQEGAGEDAGEPQAPEGGEGQPQGPAGGEAQPKGPGGKRAQNPNKVKRELAPDAPEAKALDELLAIDPRYAADGTVALAYTFREPEHLTDWDQDGFDRAEEARNRVGNKARRAAQLGKTRLLILNAGSQRAGLLQHRLNLRGRFQVEFTCQVERMTTRSDLVFVVGKCGLRFGGQPVQASGSGFRPLSRAEPDRAPFEGGNRVAVRLECESGKLSAWVNGQRVLEGLELEDKVDGRVGLYARDVNLILHQVTIEGEVDKTKL